MLLGRFARFALVGGLATGIQYSLLVALVHWTGTSPIVASSIGFVVAACANYTINYHYTFRSNQRHGPALAKFMALACGGLLINWGVMLTLLRVGVFYLLAQMLATLLVLGWNFAGNSLWTFRVKLPRANRTWK